MFLSPIYSTNDVSTALHLCTTETALCDFCPASCLDVPKEAKKYRAEFLGTHCTTERMLWDCDFCPACAKGGQKIQGWVFGHFAFGLGQGSELCASIGCRRKGVAQSFVSELQSRTGWVVWVWGQSLVCSWVPPCPQAWITQLLSNCTGFAGWSLLRTDSSDGADSHSPGTNSVPINAQRLWQVQNTRGLTPVQGWLILNFSH